MRRTTSLNRVTLMVIMLGMSGCGKSPDRDQRLAEMAEHSVETQTRQNERMADQSQQTAETARHLVEEDAKARREIADAHATLRIELQEERVGIDQQRTEMERERRELAARTAEVAEFFVAVSGPCGEIYPADKRNRVEIIPNAVDPARVVPRFGRQTMRQRWGLEPENKVVGFIGRFEKEKRPQLVVHAIADGGPLEDWHAVFVGRGKLQEHLALLAEELAPGRVHFEGHKQHLGDYFAGIDVLALPSDFEGDPLVIHEAQFAGVPIVATAMGCLLEHEQRFGKMAELVPIPARIADLQKALLTATSDAFHVVTANAHRANFANFPMPTIAARWEWFLFDAIDAWRRRETLGGDVRNVESPVAFDCAT